MSDPRVQQIVKAFGLLPHPEGGFYRETYKSTERIAQEHLPKRFKGARVFSTAIYYLLPAGAKSKLHRILSDEVWHFYLGGPLNIVGIDHLGDPYSVTLGPDFTAKHKLQHVVPAGHWFGATPAGNSPYALVGCTVAPGFDFADFTLAEKEELLKDFPNARELIQSYT